MGMYEDEDGIRGPRRNESLRGIPANRLNRIPSGPHTISSLGLNIEAAEKGDLWQLLPLIWRSVDEARRYPIPDNLSELNRLSLLNVPQSAKSAPRAYIKRCRAEYQVRCSKRDPARLQIKAQAADSVLQVIRGVEKEVKEAGKSVREEVIKASATLTDLYGLIRAGSMMILDGFVHGKPVNGQPVNAGQFTNLTGKVLGHIAKLGGVSDDDKAEAESAVFEAAVQATRKRLEDDKKVGVTAPSTATEQ